MHRMSMVALMALALLPVPRAADAAQDEGPANLSGVWKLNPEASTLPPEQGPEGRLGRGGPGAQGGRPPGAMGGPGGGMGGPGAMGGPPAGMGRPSEADLKRMEAVRRRIREAPARLTIVRDGGRIAFTEGTGANWAVTTDGRKQLRLTGDGEIETKGAFKGDALVVEEALGKVSITYEYRVRLEGDREMLEVTVVPKGGPRGGPGGPGRGPDGQGPPPIVRVYDRVE